MWQFLFSAPIMRREPGTYVQYIHLRPLVLLTSE